MRPLTSHLARHRPPPPHAVEQHTADSPQGDTGHTSLSAKEPQLALRATEDVLRLTIDVVCIAANPTKSSRVASARVSRSSPSAASMSHWSTSFYEHSKCWRGGRYDGGRARASQAKPARTSPSWRGAALSQAPRRAQCGLYSRRRC